MKHLKIIIIVFLCGLTTVSCQSLNEKPTGNLTLNDVFNKPITTLGFLNTIYSYIPAYGMDYNSWAMMAQATDDGFGSAVTEPQLAALWYGGGLSPQKNPFNHSRYNHYFYNNWWAGIRKANVFLAHIDNANLGKHSGSRSRLKAEAQLLRAFFYLQLIEEYGGMPIFTKPLPVDFNYRKLKRPTFNKVVQFIVKYCQKAINNSDLPWRISTSSKANRFTKAVAYAIESEATLYNASPLWNPNNDNSKWKQAANISKKALNALLAHGYKLYPDYEEYYLRGQDFNSNPSDRETILQYRDPMKWPAFVNQIPIKGLPYYKAGTTPTQELVDSYDMQATGEPPILGYKDKNHLHPIINKSSGYDPLHPYEGRDPRFYATVWYNQAKFPDIKGQEYYKLQIYEGGAQGISQTNKQYTHTGYYLRKYIDPDARSKYGGSSQWKIYQLAEIYLNYAEAANEAYGPVQGVYKAIKAIRNRVNMPPYPKGLTKSEMRKRIHNERRVELSFEEKRFWDVRRWKILDKTAKLSTGMRWTKNPDGTFTPHRFVVVHKESWKPKYLIFPIPLSEISKLGWEQNPGW